MKKYIVIVILCAICTIFLVLIFHQIIIWRNELSQKKIRANCGVNFERLRNILFSDANKRMLEVNNVKDCFDTLKIEEMNFLPLYKNKTFMEGLDFFPLNKYQKNIKNKSYPLIYDKKSVHKNGLRHVLMSDGEVYLLSENEFKKWCVD